MDAKAVAHAARRLPLVQALLAGAHADIACFHLEFGRWRVTYRCTLWRTGQDGAFDIADGTRQVARGALSEIGGALAPLARGLAARWPSVARPSVIGLATDGHRILFSADHPSCAGSDWLDQHIAGRSPCALIAGGGDSGPLARFCPSKGTMQ